MNTCPALNSGRYFTALLASGLALYFITPFLPGTGLDLLLGAAAVALFAFLFLNRTMVILHRRGTSGVLLAGVAFASVLGVYGLNRALYNFERIPPISGETIFVEQPESVVFVEKTGEASEDHRVVATFPKRFWLAKTFAVNILLLSAAASLGALIGRQVAKASHIFAIIVLGAVMDLWSVTMGVTEQIAATPHSYYFFLLNWPLAGRGGVTYPLIGSADFFFVALFLFLAHRFGLPLLRNTLGMAAAVALSILSALVLQKGVPALPFIGASVLAVNFRSILPDRKELFQILAGSAILLALFAYLWERF